MAKIIKMYFQGFNLETIEKEVIKRCIADYPDDTLKQISVHLNISERTLYRKINHYKIPYFKKSKGRTSTLDSAIEFVKGNGYEVTIKTN